MFGEINLLDRKIWWGIFKVISVFNCKDGFIGWMNSVLM